METIGTLLFSSLAQAIFAVLVEDVHELSGTRSLLFRLKNEPHVDELRIAIEQAFKEFRKEYPAWAESLFDETFLVREAVALELAKLLTPIAPDLSVIEEEYLAYFPTSKPNISKPLAFFIAELEKQIKLRPKLQSFVQNRNIELIQRNTRENIELLRAILDILRQQVANQNAVYIDTQVDAVVTDDPEDILERPVTFVRRDKLVEDVHSALKEHRHVLLQGFPGNGKTALASEIASKYCEAGKSYILWVHLGTEGSEAVLNAIVQALTEKPFLSSLSSRNSRIRQIKDLLKKRRITLVILDDIWNGEALKYILDSMPKETMILGTSRNRHPLLYHVPVSGLERREALQLLSYYSSKSVEDDPYADQLCEILSDNPFALRMAGMIISPNVDDLEPNDLLDQIKSEPHTLQLDFGEVDRQSIERLINFSVKSLSERERELFFSFGAFGSRNISTELISMYAMHLKPGYGKRKQTERTLAQIARYGLIDSIISSPNNIKIYNIHSLAHSYAKGLLTNQSFEAMMEVCLTFTNLHSKPNIDDLNAIRADFPNLLRAIEWAVEQKQIHHVDQFVDLLYSDEHSRFIATTINLVQTKDVIEAAIALAIEVDDKRLVAKYTSIIAGIYSSMNENNLAKKYYEEALNYAEENNLIGAKAGTLINLGILYHKTTGKTQVALKYYLDAREIYQKSDQPNDLFAVQIDAHIGNAYRELGDFITAIKMLTEALTGAQTLSHHVVEAQILGYLGSAYRESGDIEKAITVQYLCLDLQNKLRHPHGIAYTYRNLGNIYNDSGNFKEALQAYEKSLETCESIGYQLGMGVALDSIGDLYTDQQKREIAIDYYSRALELFYHNPGEEGKLWAEKTSGKLSLAKTGMLYQLRKQFKRSKKT